MKGQQSIYQKKKESTYKSLKKSFAQSFLFLSYTSIFLTKDMTINLPTRDNIDVMILNGIMKTEPPKVFVFQDAVVSLNFKMIGQQNNYEVQVYDTKLISLIKELYKRNKLNLKVSINSL